MTHSSSVIFLFFGQISMNVLPAMVAVVALALMWMAPSLATARVGFCSTLMEEHVTVSRNKKCIIELVDSISRDERDGP